MRAAGLALAVVSLWANRVGCCRLAGHTPHTVRGEVGPAALRDAVAPPPDLRALVFGDFGDDTCQQAAVAKGIAAAHARRPFDLAISVGDNVYECGPDPRLPGAAACAFGPDGAAVVPGYRPPDDPRFARSFEAPLAPLLRDGRPVPVWLALGNHDVHFGRNCREGDLAPQELARLRACLEVAHRGAHWRMPARHYAVDHGPVRFVVIDSNILVGDYGGFRFEDEVAFFREATAGCAARPCFAVAHHPPANAGRQTIDEGPAPGEGGFAARLRRLEEAAGGPVAAWFAGHHHDLQHVRAAGRDVFVSGNGSRWRDEKFVAMQPRDARLFFASTAWGFAILEASAARWSVRFENEKGDPLHCCEAAFPGPCRPVACDR